MKSAKNTVWTTLAVAITMAFTLSCSSDDGDESKSTGGTEILSSSDTESSSSGNVIVSCNDIMYGTDSFTCGGQTYKTVKIGTQTWMAENLNYETSTGSWCYDDDADNCATYGRLYDWATAKAVCPSSWHLPSRDEWLTLIRAVDPDALLGDDLNDVNVAGTKLKATSGWGIGEDNGTDDYGFSASSGGLRYSGGSFIDVGSFGSWWSATENSGSNAYRRYMSRSIASVGESIDFKSFGFSVRCVKD